MEFALTALPLLAFLACPLMMVVCFVGMRKMGCSAPRMTERQTAGQTDALRVTALQDQLTAVQSELASLRAEEAPPYADRFPQTIRSNASSAPQVRHVARRPT